MNGWHVVKTGGRWFVRYFQDGKSYLCDPESYERACADHRVPCNLDVLVLGPVALYERAVVIEPPAGRGPLADGAER